MLSHRVATAVVLLALFGLDLFLASTSLFALSLGFIAAAAAWEWSRLAGVANEHAQTAYASAIGLVALVVLHLPPETGFLRWAMLAGFLLWAAVPALLYLAPVQAPLARSGKRALALGALAVVLATLAIQYLRSHAPLASPWLLLYAFAVVWLMDIGAYFAGRRFGRRKLAPSISPKKTWEGVWGGLAATAALLAATLLFADLPPGYGTRLALATGLAAPLSVYGDLFESRLKRAAGRKDSSALLPGHGGVLDRVDGVLAALPAFAFAWAWL